MLPVGAENRSLRQPSCSGNSAVSLTPFVRDDVRAAELQSVELYWSSLGYVNNGVMDMPYKSIWLCSYRNSPALSIGIIDGCVEGTLVREVTLMI